MSRVFSEQEQVRRDTLKKITALGIDAYPAAKYEVNANAKDIKANYERNKLDYKNISIAGRLMGKRIMGKASFAELKGV